MSCNQRHRLSSFWIIFFKIFVQQTALEHGYMVSLQSKEHPCMLSNTLTIMFPSETATEHAAARAQSSSGRQRTMCAQVFLSCSVETGLGKQHKRMPLLWLLRLLWVLKSFVFDPRVSCLLPASVKLWQEKSSDCSKIGLFPVPDEVISHLLLWTTLRRHYHCHHFTNKETDLVCILLGHMQSLNYINMSTRDPEIEILSWERPAFQEVLSFPYLLFKYCKYCWEE